MTDAVLGAIGALISSMNAFYVSVMLIGISIVMILLMLFRDETWWRGLFLAMFGAFFDIAIVYAVANRIVPTAVSYLVWLGYLFIIVGGFLTIVGLLDSWVRLGLK